MTCFTTVRNHDADQWRAPFRQSWERDCTAERQTGSSAIFRVKLLWKYAEFNYTTMLTRVLPYMLWFVQQQLTKVAAKLGSTLQSFSEAFPSGWICLGLYSFATQCTNSKFQICLVLKLYKKRCFTQTDEIYFCVSHEIHPVFDILSPRWRSV